MSMQFQEGDFKRGLGAEVHAAESAGNTLQVQSPEGPEAQK